MVKMSNFVPENIDLRIVLRFLFLSKKSAAESYRLLVEGYGGQYLSQNQCQEWFKRFKGGNFSIEKEERGRPPKKFENTDLQELLDEDSTRTQSELAELLQVHQTTISERLHAMGKIWKEGKWVPHQLNERQQEKRKNISEMLLARHERKSFLYRIVTGDEKWIYFENPKRKKSWLSPGQASTSTPKPSRYGKKTMLCVWWDQDGILYYEMLKPGETVDKVRYRQQMINLNHALIEKRPKWATRHGKVILLHDNAPAHTEKRVKETIAALKWEVLAHPPYSPDLAPSDYHLFSSMSSSLKDQHFKTYQDVKKWLDEWFASKSKKFFEYGIHALPERWSKCVVADGTYFE